MLKLFLVLIIILFVAQSAGVFFCKRFSLKDTFNLPIGFGFYLFVLQLVYYPIQFYQLNSIFIMIGSLVVSGVFGVYGLIHLKEMICSLNKLDYLWIVISTALFVFVFYRLSVALDFSDSSVYLNYIAQNIDIDRLNYFDFWTGKIQYPNEPLYLYQGYYHFGSFLCWLTNVPTTIFGVTGYVANIVVCTWGLGIIYSVVSSVFVLEIVNYFKIENRFVHGSIIAFLLFYFNYYYWRVGFAFYGNTFRTLFTGMMLYYLYRMYSKHENVSLLVVPVLMGAGLASSSSFLFIVFDIVYLVMAFLYVFKKEESFRTLSIMVFPMVLFTIGLIGYFSMPLAHGVMLVVALYYYFMNHKVLSGVIKAADDFLIKYGKWLLLVVFPLGLVIFSWVLCQNPYYLSNYAHYFENHADYDMVLDPFGMYANFFERIYLLLRWIGMAILCVKSIKEKNYFIPFMLLGAFVIFLNPLTTPAIAKLYADFVYYRAFDILFNPFTLVIYLVMIYQAVQSKRFIVTALCAVLMALTATMHLPLVNSDWSYSSYSYMLQQGENENSLFKMTNEDYQIAQIIKDLGIMESDHQITMISHAQGLRTFFPKTYQIFSRRQIFDESKRVNEEFYQLARFHYGWEENEELDYSKSCSYIEEYDVDLAVIQYYSNYEFDQATDACMITVGESYNYKIKVSK